MIVFCVLVLIPFVYSDWLMLGTQRKSENCIQIMTFFFNNTSPIPIDSLSTVSTHENIIITPECGNFCFRWIKCALFVYLNPLDLNKQIYHIVRKKHHRLLQPHTLSLSTRRPTFFPLKHPDKQTNYYINKLKLWQISMVFKNRAQSAYRTHKLPSLVVFDVVRGEIAVTFQIPTIEHVCSPYVTHGA